MKMREEWKAALAVTAALSGVGFASGREIVLFFAQLGWAAWPGIVCASGVFGLLTGMTAHFAAKTGAKSFAGVYRRLLGGGAGHVAGVLHGLLMAFVMVMMLALAGELGALALPMPHGFLHGMLAALLVAMIVCMGGMRLLPWMGVLLALGTALFYGGMFLDARPPRIYMRCETELALEGSLVSAVLLALLYACIVASASGGVAAAFSGKCRHPGRIAVLSSLLLCVGLAFANLALLRGGRDIFVQALPTVILAARWGIWGFWISVIYMYSCAVCTLAAAMGSLISQFGECPGRKAVAAMPLAAFFAVYAFAGEEVVSFGYPLLGWLCAFFLAGMACLYDGKKACFPSGKKSLSGSEKLS